MSEVEPAHRLGADPGRHHDSPGEVFHDSPPVSDVGGMRIDHDDVGQLRHPDAVELPGPFGPETVGFHGIAQSRGIDRIVQPPLEDLTGRCQVFPGSWSKDPDQVIPGMWG